MSFSYRRDDNDEPSYTSNITGVAISNQNIVILSTIGFGALGLVLFLILRRLRETDDDDDNLENVRGRDVYGEMLDHSDVATLNRAQRRARAKFRMKKARRAAAPGQQAAGIDGDEAADVAAQVAREGGDAGDANLSRKERQKAAKAMEKEERKADTEKARLLRERKQSTMKSEGSSSDERTKMNKPMKEKELSLEEIFPRYTNEDDASSEVIFWGSIMKNIKQRADSSGEMISIALQIPRVTIHDFFERLKADGSVSIATLADEFSVSIPDALAELESINKEHGIVGIPDSSGNFVYVSMEMIRKAIQTGQEAGITRYPR